MSRAKRLMAAGFALAALLAPPSPAMAGELNYELRIHDHHFVPDRLEVAAGQEMVLVVINEDQDAEEFECFSLKREKVVKGDYRVRIRLGPLAPGEYPFVGDYHPDTAKGVILAR